MIKQKFFTRRKTFPTGECIIPTHSQFLIFISDWEWQQVFAEGIDPFHKRTDSFLNRIVQRGLRNPGEQLQHFNFHVRLFALCRRRLALRFFRVQSDELVIVNFCSREFGFGQPDNFFLSRLFGFQLGDFLDQCRERVHLSLNHGDFGKLDFEPEFLFFSALVNSMREHNVRQKAWTASVLYAEYDWFFYSPREEDGPVKTKKQNALRLARDSLHTRRTFYQLTLPSLVSARAGKRFVFNEEFLELRLGERYDEGVLLTSEKLFK